MIEKFVKPVEELNYLPLKEDMSIHFEEDTTVTVMDGEVIFYIGDTMMRIPEYIVSEVSCRIAQQRVLEFMKKQKIIKDEKEKAND
jgi:hypothetical protein